MGTSPCCGPLELRDRFLTLHLRILSGDDQADSEVVQLLAPEIRAQLHRRFPREHPHVIEDAIDDALMKYLQHPELFEPARGHPLSWFVAVAANAVIDQQRARTRNLRVEVCAGIDLARFSLPLTKMADPSDWVDAARRVLMGMARSEQDRAFIAAKLADEPIDVQARILGVSHLPTPDQRTMTRRAWKTILRRLERSRYNTRN